MMLQTMIGGKGSGSRVRRWRSVRKRSVRGKLWASWPSCERMEDRTLLASMLWINAGGGDWDLASNWVNSGNSTDHHVPTAGDDAAINVSGITVAHTSTGSDVVHSLTSQAAIKVSAGGLGVATTAALQANLTLDEGSLIGGTWSTTGAAILVGSGGGTLTGVTVNGDLDLSQNSSYLRVYNGLVLNGTMDLGNADGSIAGNVYFGDAGEPAGSLTGNATVVFGENSNNSLSNDSDQIGAAGTLTLGPAVTIHGNSGSIRNNDSTGTIVNQGTINADTAGGTIDVSDGTFTNAGTLQASAGTLAVSGSVTINGSSQFASSVLGTIQIGGNLLGNVQNPVLFTPQGATVLNGSGTSSSPQLLEAMSQDLGSGSTGFSHNFALGTLALDDGTYAKLVDQSDNAPGGGREAVYASSLIVPDGCTLDLNGLHLYARAAQLEGTVLNGSVGLVPDGGPLTIDTPTPGTISVAGEQDEWTFFGRGGKQVTVWVNPSGDGSPAPVSPQLQWANVQLLDASNHVLASASDASEGGIVTLSNVVLPADGTYTIQINAPAEYPDSTGNYLVAAWDVTSNVRSLNLDQTSVGTITTPNGLDQWNFSASAGQQVQFHLLNTSDSGLAFTLTGPNGYAAFTDLSDDSPLITLPSSGRYTLAAHGLNGAMGSYAFVLEQTTRTDLVLGVTYSGTL
ncbi:MAG TPA: hypothetical protein VJY33_01285, partial [Isosphaeraceae bacterium]|nr:hypothetical protein [Isosphaeraceae bacterium]